MEYLERKKKKNEAAAAASQIKDKSFENLFDIKLTFYSFILRWIRLKNFVDFKHTMTILSLSLYVCVFHNKNQSICVTVFGFISCTNFIFSEVASDHVECFMNELWNCQRMRFAHGIKVGSTSRCHIEYTHIRQKKRSKYFGFAWLFAVSSKISHSSVSVSLSLSPCVCVSLFSGWIVVVSELWAITGNQFEQIRYIYQLFTSFYLSSVIH